MCFFSAGQAVFASSHSGGTRFGESWCYCSSLAGFVIIQADSDIHHVANHVPPPPKQKDKQAFSSIVHPALCSSEQSAMYTPLASEF